MGSYLPGHDTHALYLQQPRTGQATLMATLQTVLHTRACHEVIAECYEMLCSSMNLAQEDSAISGKYTAQ